MRDWKKVLGRTTVVWGLSLALLASCSDDGTSSPVGGDTQSAQDVAVADTAGADSEEADSAGEGAEPGPDTTADSDTTAGADDAGSDVADATPEPDTEPGPVGIEELPDGLNGVAIEPFLAPIEFAGVVDSEGQPVAPGDLLAAPTVMWFFPFANTAG